jgi:sugar lactone lactonase YvrE
MKIGTRSRLILAMLVFVLLAFLGAVSATADEPSRSDAAFPASDEISQAIESGPSQATLPWLTEPRAAEGVAHRDLGRSEALELLQGVFERQLQAPAGPFDELDVEKFLAPNVAVVHSARPESSASTSGEAPGNRSAALVDSTIPLRTGGSAGPAQAIDLSLEQTGEQLQPANPLVDVAIPEQLGDGIELPGVGVQIDLVDAPEQRSPSTLMQSVAAYPNVAQDTDLVVAPTPTGVEALSQIRSADAPRSQSFALTLPGNAVLKATENGGAQVSRDGETLMDIAAPTALDAAGNEVPVTLDVYGSSLTLTISPLQATQFPVLLDPLFQTWEWMNKDTNAGICNSSYEPQYEFEFCGPPFEEWIQGEHYEDYHHEPHLNLSYTCFSCLQYGVDIPGLSITAQGSLTVGDRASWIYAVPRYVRDQEQYNATPTSFIAHMTLSSLSWSAESNYLSPYLFAGIWDPVKPGWVSVYSHESLAGHGLNDLNWQYQFPNANGNTNAKVAELAIQATATEPSSGARAYVGMATVELADNGIPSFGSVSGPAHWVDQTPSPIPFSVSDSGLGVQSLIVSSEQLGEGNQPLHSWTTPFGCIGVADAACPRTWKSTETGHPQAAYDPSVLPQGINYLNLTAKDPVGNVSQPASARIKVDHTAPSLNLWGGTLIEQDELGTKRASYTLNWSAIDGNTEHPQSGIVATSVKVDGKVVQESTPPCAETDNCRLLSGEWLLVSSEYSEGPHVVEVTATDEVGLATTRELPIELYSAPPPDLDLSGSITEQSTLGQSRPRYTAQLDASTGEEDPAASPGTLPPPFGSMGSGTGELEDPADVAVDSDGNIWVADTGNDRIEGFNEAGEYLRQFNLGPGVEEQIRPVGLAIDAEDDIWVVDSRYNRIWQFSNEGEVLSMFDGGWGTGQLTAPQGIAIDSDGDIWVADTGSSRVLQFDPSGDLLTVAGAPGSGAGQIGSPADIDIGPDDNLWVADSENNRIEEFNQYGKFQQQFGSSGTDGGELQAPGAIALDRKGHIWVGDVGNNRIEEFNRDGEYVGQLGSAGSEEYEFDLRPATGIATDSDGRIWITDTGNDRIQTWQAPAFSGQFGLSGSGDGQFDQPSDIAVDAIGNEWVADTGNNRIEQFDGDGKFLTALGTLGSGNGQLNQPTALDVDSMGNVWVVDTGNDRVEVFNEMGEYIRQFGSTGTADGQFLHPEGIALLDNGNVFVADTGNDRIQKFNSNGEYLAQFGTSGSDTGQFNEPVGVAALSRPAFSAFTACLQYHIRR